MRIVLPAVLLISACAAPRTAAPSAAVANSGLRTVVVTTSKLE